MDRIIGAVKAKLPKFNDFLIKEFREQQLNSSADFMSIIFQEAIKLFKGEIEYIDYRIMSPEEKATYELTSGQVNIKHSEWNLVEYQFKCGTERYTVPIYLPYMHNGYIVINNTQYNVQLAVCEKVFTKINDGLTAKVVRSPINFWRNKTYIMTSASSDATYFESIVTTKVHNEDTRHKKKKAISPTIVHYLLCKYGLEATLKVFNIPHGDVTVVQNIDHTDIDLYEYFPCQMVAKTKTPIMLKVRTTLLDSEHLKQRKVIASILYLLNNFKKHTIADLYDPTNTVYRVMLGKLIQGAATTDATALSYINNHMASLDSYLDPITGHRLETMGIYVKDIYDLFIYIFWNIDEILVGTSHSDLYDKRIDVLDNLLVTTIVKAIYYNYYKFYTFENRLKSNPKLVDKLLRLSSRKVSGIYKSSTIRMNPSRYNDNGLLSVWSKKVRLNNIKRNTSVNLINVPEQRFHPSFGYVESLIAFSQSNPGSAGTINPYVAIDENGFIIKQDYCDKLDEITQYLPHK